MQHRLQSGRVSKIGLVGSSAILALVTAAGAAQAADKPAAQGTSVQEVVVTGSRIARRDYTSASPIVTVTSQSLQNTAEVSIDQALNKLPQFVGGQNQITSAGDVQATPTSSPGAATIGLRGLGTNRTLTLLDGKRTQPINANLDVDINTIPKAAIDSVEILTGGAAATYGADAVAGVVNFKLKHNYQGATFDAQYGETFHGDGATFELSSLLGGNFADEKGHAMVGMVYSNRDPIYQADREFYRRAWSDPGVAGGDFFPNFPGFNNIPYDGTHAGAGGSFPFNTPSFLAIQSVFGSKSGYAFGDYNPFTALYFNTASTTAGSTVFAVAPGAVSHNPAIGYTGHFYPDYKILNNGQLSSNATNQLLSIPLTRYSIFSSVDYNLTDHLTVYMQGNFVQTDITTALGGHVPAVNQWGVTIPYDSATNGVASGHPVPGELATLLNSRALPDAPWQLNNELDFLGPRSLHTSFDTFEVMGGFKGDIGYKDWTFDLYGSHGRTQQLVTYHGFGDQARYQALINMPNYGAGADFNYGLDGRLAHCTSGINPFLNTPVSQDCVDIVQSLLKTSSDLTQDIVEFDTQGSITTLPAGDLRFSAGADYRSNTFDFLPDPAMSTTNITSTSLGIFDAAPAHGSTKVYEGYGELLIPVLKDMELVKDLNLDGSYRYSSYNTGAGNVSTWKVSADWDINDYVKIRGSYEVANRAPNIAELFESSTVVVNLWPDSDPCANTTVAPYGNIAANPNRSKVIALCNALPGVQNNPISPAYGGLGFYFPLSLDQQLGNQDLHSEDATTWSVGTVLKSPFTQSYLSRLRATIDYYNISINHAIAALTSQTIYQQCLNGLGTNPNYDPANSYCQLIRRNASGATDTVLGEFTNLGSIKTSGIDASIDWNADVGQVGDLGMGTVFLNLQFNWLEKYDVVSSPGAPVLHYADTIGTGVNTPPYGAQFKWKLYTTLGFNVGPGSISMTWQHLPEVRNVALAGNPNSAALPSPSYDLFGLAGRWQITPQYEFRAGIDNLFDKEQPIVGAIPGVTTASGITDISGAYDVIGRRFYMGLKARF
jgi:outer membrane receptor protein involved in Fe transport